MVTIEYNNLCNKYLYEDNERKISASCKDNKRTKLHYSIFHSLHSIQYSFRGTQEMVTTKEDPLVD